MQSTVLIAQEPEEGTEWVQEVFRGELPYAQDARELQLTLGSNMHGGHGDRTTVGRFAVEYGLTDRWQVALEAEPFQRESFRGASGRNTFGEIELGTLLSFPKIAGVSLDGALQLTAAQSGFGQDDAVEWGGAALLARGLKNGLVFGGVRLESAFSDEPAEVELDGGIVLASPPASPYRGGLLANVCRGT